jgi:uncharacterized repeat protein (TIGR02543 family)
MIKKIIPVAAIMMATSLLTASPVLAATSTSTVNVTIVDGKNTKDTSDDTKYTVTLNKGTKMTDAQISKVKVWASGDTVGRTKVVQAAYNPVVPATIKNKFSKNTTLKLTYKQTKPIVNFVDSTTKKVFETKVGEVGQTIKFPKAPAHKGFEFKSWSGLTESKKLTKATTYKATANYKELKVKIIFDGNGADNPNAMKSVEVPYSKKYTLPKNKYVHDNYVFSCWHVSDYSDAQPGQKIDVSFNEGDPITIKAGWEAAQYYEIVYDLHEGRFNTQPKEFYTEITKTFTLPTPKKDGNTFVGWTGTGLKKVTKSVSIKKGSTGVRRYFAVWKDSSLKISNKTATNLGKWDLIGVTGDEKALSGQQIYTHNGCYITRSSATKYNLKEGDAIVISTTGETLFIDGIIGDSGNPRPVLAIALDKAEKNTAEYNKTATIYLLN